MHKILSAACVVLVISIFSGCAPKAYKIAVNNAVRLENQQQYEEAYSYYKQALNVKPDDRRIQQKIEELGRIISDAYTQQANEAFKNRKYRTALGLLEKALEYNSMNPDANALKTRTEKAYKKITDKYARVENFCREREWIKAVNTLKEISGIYNDDPDIEEKIEKCRNDGFKDLMNAGRTARKKGEYAQSLGYFKLADLLKPGQASQDEIRTAEKYVQADKLYARAKERLLKKDVLGAMKVLIRSKDLVDDHSKINQMIVELTPKWSPLIFEDGKKLLKSGRTNRAFTAFSDLKKINPQYPGADEYFQKARSRFLRENYRLLTVALSAGDFPRMKELSEKIMQEDPEFLDTREIVTRSIISAFNVYYQQGLAYLKTENNGKAILCFRSAERNLAKTRLTRDGIKEAWGRIKKRSSLHIVFLNFSQEIGDPSVSEYLTARIRDHLKREVRDHGFKNLFIEFKGSDDSNFLTDTGFTRDIDWGAVLSRGFNAVMTGRIGMLQLDTSVNSEWKTRKRTVRKIVDNERYTSLIMRQAELKAALRSRERRPSVTSREFLDLSSERRRITMKLESGLLSDQRRARLQKRLADIDREMAQMPRKRQMKKSQIENELKIIAETIPIIPPKIEINALEETPYQCIRHTMTAHLQIDTEILAPDGSYIWPMKHYEDVYQIEDSVVPPNLMSEDPKERLGDPLTLPSETEFKQQAIDHIVGKKIIPDLIQAFRNYGMRFYARAKGLDKQQGRSGFGVPGFLDSIEEYYKFLACYEDKGEQDSLTEDVEHRLDAYVGADWLLRRKKK
ncbi:MAG: hypothetical protein DRH37_03270 [Deltaproteobacteria bacterium]|nr:MAG: hypothetical protein DRH37_03270 [Deltaproteobacteria bacterium]